jgi:hypothetical protein
VTIFFKRNGTTMIWTIELATYLDDAPWPATKEELIDYAVRTGAPTQVIQNLEELDDSDEPYESIEEIWPDYPTDEDFFFEDEKEY